MERLKTQDVLGESREFWELNEDSYVVCEERKNKPLVKIIICYVCREKDKCKKNLRLWKGWFKWLENKN